MAQRLEVRCGVILLCNEFNHYFTLLVGLFSVIMRDLANLSGDGPKWIVLDGDIDPMWIESLNTVMDDNKVNKWHIIGLC